MKKTISVLLAVLMGVTLAACGSETADNAPSDTGAASVPPNEAPVQTTENESGTAVPPQEDTQKVLVAYFSCTGTTKALAEYLADGLESDLYEITPVDPYTDADLDYGNDDSRSTREMNDPDSRPAISGSVADMSQYDIVFIGYPIWWGEAPRIINTFVESYDFSGKTIIPFCTSGGSGIGSSGTNLAKLTESAKWLAGKRFSGGTSRADMLEWINGLGLDIKAE